MLLVNRLITPQKPFHDPHSVAISKLLLLGSVENCSFVNPDLYLERISSKNVENGLQKQFP